MYKWFALLTISTAIVAVPAFAEQRLDPIFRVMPVEGPPAQSCFERDSRGPVVESATGVVGQTIIGGLLGALIGDQIGSGSGNDIAVGVGVAVGAAAGAWNAQRMREERIRSCQQYQGYVRNYGGDNYGGGHAAYQSAGGYQRVRY